ncbi:Hypothetical predicted protein [Mytilus galloprovincialis]|uniref:Kringle domain-containing protein n=1 Tax=Mytilus galloprovincialis TaxID=29158 RepID=A0A8B6CAZ3_MYTGA|nr:Hypothetical predicted protein [Mytilus galloprovincialis]
MDINGKNIAADCYWTTSLEYSGTISYTFSGIPCQYWNTDYPHTIQFKPVDPTALDTNYCRESTNREGGDACGIDERLPDKPTGTTFHFKMGKFIGMVFTCDKLLPGTSVEHHPVSTCGSDDQWTTGYTTSCTENLYLSCMTQKSNISHHDFNQLRFRLATSKDYSLFRLPPNNTF